MKHWIFDLDGTLVDTVDHYALKIRKIFAYFEIPINQEDLDKSRHFFDARRFFSLYLDAVDVNRACELLNEFSLKMAPEAKLFDGVKDLLHFLKSQNVQLSLWTGRDEASTKSILQHCGLESFFENCITGSCVVNKKPDPEGLLKALQLSNYEKDQTVMVGDHLFDIEGAKSAGVRALSVSWKDSTSHPLESISDVHFYKTSDLTAWAKSQLNFA